MKHASVHSPRRNVALARAAIGTLVMLVLGCKGEARQSTPADTSAAAPAASAPATAAAEPTAATMINGPSTTPTQAPDSFRVVMETSKGPITMVITRALSPRAVDRFHELVTSGYFNDVRFFRHVPGFIVQFGMHGDPEINKVWEKAALPDEPMKVSNTRGTLVFATAGPNTRSNQLYFNLGDNTASLDPYGNFSPFGSVVEGLDVMDKLNGEYGEQPNQARIASDGNAYLSRQFPALDYVKSVRIVP